MSLALLPVGTAIYWLALPRQWRTAFLFGASVAFAAVFSLPFTAYFLLNVALTYVAGRRIERKDATARTVLQLTLAWLVGNLLFFKYTNRVLEALFSTTDWFSLFPRPELPRIVLPLGISYVIFRLIHYAVEVYRRKIPRGTFVDLGLYVLFFPTFLAGPVDRFGNLLPQMQAQRGAELSDINQGLFRLVLGMIRKFVVADTLAHYIVPVLEAPWDHARWIVALSVYGLAIRVYMDFSGYTDMAIGVARLFGYRIIENFNRPFLQKNIAMFWRSWHMSVYGWIRDYFFFPIFGYRASNLKIYVGIFCTMLVFMLWHEASLSWLSLGIYHGSGLVVWQLLQELKRKHPPLRRLLARPWVTPVSIALTFTFVTFGFLIFSLDVGQIASILRRLF